MDSERFQLLLDRYFDQSLDDEMAKEFDQFLLSSPKAREMFWQQGSLHAMLRQIGMESWTPKATDEHQVVRSASAKRSSLGRRLGAALTAAVLIGVCGYAYFATQTSSDSVASNDTGSSNAVSNPSQSEQAHSANPSTAGGTSTASVASRSQLSQKPNWLAVLRSQFNVEWDNPAEEMIAGEAMNRRRLKFSTGQIEVQTNRGVTINLEGPADLEIISGMEVVCRKGRLRVDVPPPAIGFVVRTPQFDLVDKGTTFAMDVNGNKKSEVLVIKGKVEIVPGAKGTQRLELLEGDAIGISDGVVSNASSKEASFPSSNRLQSIIRQSNSLEFNSWRRKRASLSSAADCIAYFDFQRDADSNNLVNRSLHADSSGTATIVGAKWAEGRWPGKQALEFRNPFDRVLFSLPEKHKSITCLASVRLDSLEYQAVALLAPFEAENHSFRWNIVPSPDMYGKGHLQIQRFMNDQWRSITKASQSPFLQRSRLGTWGQVAFVYDAEDRIYKEYVNGRLLCQRNLSQASSRAIAELQFGQMQIGNQPESSSSSTAGLGHLVGRIDELAIFRRALSTDEVRVLQLGRHATWTNEGDDSDWNSSSNWCRGLRPASADSVRINRPGKDAAVSTDATIELSSVSVGMGEGSAGQLRITGGEFRANEHPQWVSRVGAEGGEGFVSHEQGEARFSALQIGLGGDSFGRYRLDGGDLVVTRDFETKVGKNASLSIGIYGGTGRLEIASGSLTTRKGIRLGQTGGVGTFLVEGSKPERIHVGSYNDFDGYWYQESASTLDVRIDAGGVTPILIKRFNDEPGDGALDDGNVTFKEGSILNLSFSGAPRSGSWDVMRWDGELLEDGLKLAQHLDNETWSFDFVDTDDSGSPDTLRVTANVGK